MTMCYIRGLVHLFILLLSVLSTPSSLIATANAFMSADMAAQSRQALVSLGDETTCMNTCRSCHSQKAPRMSLGIDAVSSRFTASTGVGVNRKFFFLHIPNTGGSVVERGIKAAACQPRPFAFGANASSIRRGGFGNDICFCGRNSSQFEALSKGRYRITRAADQHGKTNHLSTSPGSIYTGVDDYAIFCGRRPWGMLSGFVEAHAPVTAVMLRDPITQAASHWDQSIKVWSNHSKSFQDAIRYSISTYGKQETVGHKRGALFRNEQVYWLCGLDCSPSMPISDALASAKRNLQRTAAIGTADHMLDLFEQLHSILPWWPSKNIMKSFDTSASSSVVSTGGVGAHTNASMTSNLPTVAGLKHTGASSTAKLAFAQKNVENLAAVHATIVSSTPADAIALLKEFLWADMELYAFAQDLAQEKALYAVHCRALAKSTNCTDFISDCH